MRQLRCLFLLLTFFLNQAFSQETFDSGIEARYLQNIKQLTFLSMGFEKAGEGYFSPDSQTIIFQAVPNGQKHYQIYSLNLQEMQPKMVSTGIGACTCAYFHPNGKKIIFASSHSDPRLYDQAYSPSTPGYKKEGSNYAWDFTPYMNIYEANPDGSALTALTCGPDYCAECAYSSDGSRIVFASNRSGSMNIYTMRADGSDVQQITHTHHCYNGGPFFAPDNQRIIFRADRDKQHYLQIYVVDADGLNERQLTDNGAVNWSPYWHSNGKVIAFTTSLHSHAHYEIYALNLETGKHVRLTHHADFDGLPVFNKDGTKIMWTSKRGPDNTCQLFLADFSMPKELE